MWRIALGGLVWVLSLNAAWADNSREVMQLLLSDAGLVVYGEVTEPTTSGLYIAHEGGSHVSYGCKIRVIDVIQGDKPKTEVISVSIDILRDHPCHPLKRGDKRVFFFAGLHSVEPPIWITKDIRFCVQPASMARELKQMVEEMNRLRELQKTQPAKSPLR